MWLRGKTHRTWNQAASPYNKWPWDLSLLVILNDTLFVLNATKGSFPIYLTGLLQNTKENEYSTLMEYRISAPPTGEAMMNKTWAWPRRFVKSFLNCKAQYTWKASSSTICPLTRVMPISQRWSWNSIHILDHSLFLGLKGFSPKFPRAHGLIPATPNTHSPLTSHYVSTWTVPSQQSHLSHLIILL